MALTRSIGQAFDAGERRRLGGLFSAVLLLHVVGWGLLIAYGVGHPALLGLGGLAYTFGLRHAFDADHISAIDNTTRKLMQEGKRPVAVGFFFSLGHSTIVVLLSIVVAIGAALVQTNLPQWKEAGGLIGTFVSATFLYVIGIINLLVLMDIFRMWRHV